MPRYDYKCANGHQHEMVFSMADYKQVIICPSTSCGLSSDLQVNRSFQIDIFEPYTETNFTGKPILVESAAQRDALCSEHSLSYDKTQFNRKPKSTTAVDDIDLGQVKTALETGVLPDGTKLELDAS